MIHFDSKKIACHQNRRGMQQSQKKIQKETIRHNRHAKNILTTSFGIVLLYCFQIRRNSVRKFEIQSDHTVNYSRVSENKFKALYPTLTYKNYFESGCDVPSLSFNQADMQKQMMSISQSTGYSLSSKEENTIVEYII